jgi:hypothetical protein
MAVMWPNKRMRNFMQNRIANMVFFGIADIKPRKRNNLCIIITLTGAPACMIKLDPPPGQAMLLHQFGCCFNRISKWPMNGLFRLKRRFCRQGGGGWPIGMRNPFQQI